MENLCLKNLFSFRTLAIVGLILTTKQQPNVVSVEPKNMFYLESHKNGQWGEEYPTENKKFESARSATCNGAYKHNKQKSKGTESNESRDGRCSFFY